MVTASKEEISGDIKNFFKIYFKQYFELMGDNSHKIKDLEEISYPDLDAMFIFKFVRVELGHLKNMDTNILDDDLRKLYEYTVKTVSELIKFKKEHMSGKLLFENNFLTFNNDAKIIHDEFDKLTTEKSINLSKAERITRDLKKAKNAKNATKSDEETIQLIKKLNGDLADTLQQIDSARSKLEKITIEKENFENKYLIIFLDIYKKISDKIVSQITKQINVFTFSMDRDMWKNASRSQIIMRFFEALKQPGSMNIQQYMEFHLKNQTSEDSKDEKQIKFRKKLIDAINKVKLFNIKQKSMERNKTP